MKKRLTRIAPLRAGVVLGVFYGIATLLIPLGFVIAALAGMSGAVEDAAMVALFPIIYAVAGFVVGILGAALYNLIARWTGGLEFEFSDFRTAD